MAKLYYKITIACFSLLSILFAVSAYLSGYEVKYQPEKAVSLKSLIQNQRAPASLSRSVDVIIDVGQIAYLDESTNIGTLIINGELHCYENHAPEILKLRAKEILVNGVFQCGTASKPYRKKLIISLKHSALDPKVDEGYRGINVEHGGKLILNGDRKNSGWYKLNQTITPGTQSIVLDLQPSSEASQIRSSFLNPLPWRVGDQIVIGPTGYNHLEAEKITISCIPSSF